MVPLLKSSLLRQQTSVPVLARSWATWVHILGNMGHPTMAMQTHAPVMIHPQTDSRGQNELAGKGLPEAPSVWPAPQNAGGGAGGRPGAPPPPRRRAEVTQATAISGGPKLGRNLERPRRARRRAALLVCPVAWAAPRCGEPRPCGRPGLPPREARGVRPRAPLTGRGRPAGDGDPAAGGAAAPGPGSRQHEHRRGVPHPAQLPLEQVAGQREAGAAETRAGGPAPRPLRASPWGPGPRGSLPPSARQRLGETDPHPDYEAGRGRCGKGCNGLVRWTRLAPLLEAPFQPGTGLGACENRFKTLDLPNFRAVGKGRETNQYVRAVAARTCLC